jgi:hypothetical protein
MLLPSMTVNYVTILYALLEQPAAELLAQRRPSVWALAGLNLRHISNGESNEADRGSGFSSRSKLLASGVAGSAP